VLRVAALVAAVCGALYGYDTGIIAGALLSMTDEFGLDHRSQELIASSILAGAVVGALAMSWLSERIGRKRSVMAVTAPFTLGAVACAMAPTIELLIAARVFLGIAVDGSTQVVPMYISELAPQHRRGNLVTMFNVVLGVGILLAAIDVHARMRTSRREIRHEVGQIDAVSHNADTAESGWRGICQPWLRPTLVAALGVAVFTQCGGLEMMIYYAPTFLSDAGFGRSSALFASLGVAIVYAVMTLLGCLFVDRIGRRLMLVMIPGSVASLVGLGATMRVYAGINPGSFLFVLLMVPETAGASLEDIEGALRDAHFRPARGRTRIYQRA